MPDWQFPVLIRPKGSDYVVSVRDLPEVVTAGNTHAEALELARDAIAVAMAIRIERGRELPEPSQPHASEILVSSKDTAQ